MEKHKKESPLDLATSIPFFAMLAVGFFGPFFTGLSLVAIEVAIILYYVRMFFVTGFFHRYFSHRSYKTNRFWQFIFALCTCTTVQRGSLWWAEMHRHHHAYSDEEADHHSNFWWGFLESHILWIMRADVQKANYDKIKDLSKYPELRLLENKFIGLIPPTLLAIGCYYLGEYLGAKHHTNGTQMLVVGFFTSTFALFNGTSTINSLSHMYGRRRYETKDKSLNNWFLAVFITLGEGWHNNHHMHPSKIKQGHVWYEIDITYYILEVMKFFGIIHHLRYT